MSDGVRINPPKKIDGQKLYLLMHHGYDFDPTVLAVCESEEIALQMYKEHYSNPENRDFPWNTVSCVVTTLNNWIDYGDITQEKGNLVNLAKQAGLSNES